MPERLTPSQQRELRAEQAAWGLFATAPPHEAAELDWPRFVALVRKRLHGKEISEGEIRDMLRETDGP